MCPPDADNAAPTHAPRAKRRGRAPGRCARECTSPARRRKSPGPRKRASLAACRAIVTGADVEQAPSEVHPNRIETSAVLQHLIQPVRQEPTPLSLNFARVHKEKARRAR